MDTTTPQQANEDAECQAREAEEREAKRQEQIRRNQAAIQMLQEWAEEGDPEEQRETWEIIERGLREHPFTLRTYEP